MQKKAKNPLWSKKSKKLTIMPYPCSPRQSKFPPEKFESYLYLGRLHEMCGEHERSHRYIQERDWLYRLTEKDSRHLKAATTGIYSCWGCLTYTLLEQQRRIPEQPNRTNISLKPNMCIEDALGEYPNRPETLHASGKIEYIRGNPREAVKYFEQAAKQSNIIDSKNLYYLAATQASARRRRSSGGSHCTGIIIPERQHWIAG